jgi:hypothetical protein
MTTKLNAAARLTAAEKAKPAKKVAPGMIPGNKKRGSGAKQNGPDRPYKHGKFGPSK